MRLKIDTVSRVRSATQDGFRDKLGIRAQVLDLDDEQTALELAGQVVEATFDAQQPGLFDDDEEDSDETADVVVPVPSARRRRNGTRSSEHVPSH